MKIEEADKIIAEYMGTDCKDSECDWNTKGDTCKICTDRVFDSKLKYDQSLDALVPVWGKLKKDNKIVFVLFTDDQHGWNIETLQYSPYEQKQIFHEEYENRTIQESVCLAAAKAIKEIK